MSTAKKKFNAISSYIAAAPLRTRGRLREIYALIRKLAPKAETKMAYGIPTFFLNGNLVHFAGFKEHIGFYPGAAGVAAFEKELARYKYAKGSIQFPYDRPLPKRLITRIVQYRLKQNLAKKPARKKTDTKIKAKANAKTKR